MTNCENKCSMVLSVNPLNRSWDDGIATEYVLAAPCKFEVAGRTLKVRVWQDNPLTLLEIATTMLESRLQPRYLGTVKRVLGAFSFPEITLGIRFPYPWKCGTAHEAARNEMMSDIFEQVLLRTNFQTSGTISRYSTPVVSALGRLNRTLSFLPRTWKGRLVFWAERTSSYQPKWEAISLESHTVFGHNGGSTEMEIALTARSPWFLSTLLATLTEVLREHEAAQNSPGVVVSANFGSGNRG